MGSAIKNARVLLLLTLAQPLDATHCACHHNHHSTHNRAEAKAHPLGIAATPSIVFSADAPQVELEWQQTEPTGKGGLKWTDLIQAIGIIAGLAFTGYNVLLSRKSQHVANILQLAAGYRDVWKTAFDHPELHRVLSPEVDLKADPVTDNERLFMKMLILHAFNAFLGTRSQMIFPIEGLRADIQDLLSLPIPKQVWLEIRRYQNRIFVDFVENTPSRSQKLAAASVSFFRRSGHAVKRAVAFWKKIVLTARFRRTKEPISLRLFPHDDKDEKP